MKFFATFILVVFCLGFGSNATHINTDKCLSDTHCSQCPEQSLRRSPIGDVYCCSGCKKIIFKSGVKGHCQCFEDTFSPRIIFEGYENARYPYHQPKQGGFPSQDLKPPAATTTATTKSNLDLESLAKAMTLMMNAIEKLDLRMRRVEETLGQVNMMRFGNAAFETDSVDASDKSPRDVDGCPTKFAKVGNECIYASVWSNYRANWKDAQLACERMGSALADTLNGERFVELSRYLAKESTTTGYSYWMGGIYPGALWVWLSNGKEVTKNPTYWTLSRLKGGKSQQPVVAGDSNGRCLSFYFVMDSKDYRFAGDECGFEKYFLCHSKSTSSYTSL